MKTHLLRVIFTLIFGTKPCYSQTIVKMDNGYGLVSSRNEMLVENCQSIQKVNAGREKAFILEKGNHFAVHVSSEISADGYNMYGEAQSGYKVNSEANDWSKINFEYDGITTIESRNPEIDFVVRKGDLYGTINLSGLVTLPIKYDTIFSTRENMLLTLVKKDSNYAIVPDTIAGEFSINLLSFDYDAVSFKKSEPDFVQLKKGGHYAVAYYSENGEVLISSPIFDSIISGDRFLIKTLKGDSTFFLYAKKKYSGSDNSCLIDLPAKTFFYNVSDNNQFELDLDPGKYELRLFYPFAYLIDKDSKVSIVDLGSSKIISRGGETDVKWISVAGNYYYRDYLQFTLQNTLADKYANVTILYTVLNHQEVFSYPLDPKMETLRLEFYEKDDDYLKVSCENLDTHKSKTLGYIHYGGQVTFSNEKPYKDFAISYSGGSRSGVNWMDFLWFGGR